MFSRTPIAGVKRQTRFSKRILTVGSLAKVYGAIALILEHSRAVESYLLEQEARWNRFREEHPLPDDMLERFRRTHEELSRRSA